MTPKTRNSLRSGPERLQVHGLGLPHHRPQPPESSAAHRRRQITARPSPRRHRAANAHGCRVDYAGIGFINVILWQNIYEWFRVAVKTLSFMAVRAPCRTSPTSSTSSRRVDMAAETRHGAGEEEGPGFPVGNEIGLRRARSLSLTLHSHQLSQQVQSRSRPCPR